MGVSRRLKITGICIGAGAVLALSTIYFINASFFPDVSAKSWLAAPPGVLPDPAMSGLWVQSTQSVDGKPVAGAFIDAETFTLTHPGETLAQIIETTFRIIAADADAEPKWMDLEVDSSSPRESFWQSYVGQTMSFGYEVQGDRLLLITHGPEADGRPGSIQPGRNTWMYLEMLREGSSDSGHSDSDLMVTRGDSVTLDADLLGEWVYVDELVMIHYPDTLILTAGMDGPIIIEMEVLMWDTKSNPARIDAVMIKHPELEKLGQHVRMIYERLPKGRLRMATYFDESPGYGSWPTGFTGGPGKGLIVGEWEKKTP